MNEQFEFTTQPRSSFITVLAWIFIVLAGFTTFISILQNIMITLMFPVEEITENFSNPEIRENIPAYVPFILSNVRLFVFGFFILSCTTLISAIGLLKRKNWARIIFIIIMSIGIAWNIFSYILQPFMMPAIAEFPEEIGINFKAMMTIMRIFMLFMAVGMSILFGWIIKKLTSKKIKQEFMYKQ